MTPPYPVLTRPPIREAVIEFRVVLPGDVHLGRVAQIEDRLKAKYPLRDERNLLSGGIQLRPGQAPVILPADTRVLGYLYRSADRLQVVHALLDRFAFSRLKPYESWPSFESAALEAWDSYAACLAPSQVVRIAVRYINELVVGYPIPDLSALLHTRPELADTLPSLVADYAFRVVVPSPDPSLQVSIAQTIERQPQSPSECTVVFDIDVCKQGIFSPDRDGLVRELAVLRDLKNRVFFGSLTERALENHR